MTFKEARAEARNRTRHSRGWVYIGPFKQKELGWFVQYLGEHPMDRAVFKVYQDGKIKLVDSNFAKNYQKALDKRRKT